LATLLIPARLIQQRLSRDSTGIWHARAKSGTETVDVTVDKGGRIKPGLQ
jgi:hypothetical protein